MEKILIIEDDSAVRGSIQELLKGFGYDAFAAENGREAINIIEKVIPDLVISDMMMPEIDGMEFLKIFREKTETADIPFIFLTARTEYTDLRKGMSEGADDYLIKPFKANDLLRVIRYRLDKKNREYESIKKIQSNLTAYIPQALNSPVVAISGFVDMMLSELNDLSKGEIIEYLEKIKLSAVDLHRIVKKYQIFTDSVNIINNRAEFEKGNFDTVKSVTELINITAQDIAESHKRQKDLVVNVDESGINVNKKILKTIISELFENAFKYSKKDEQVKVEGYKTGDKYNIEISNPGRRIDNKVLDNLNSYNLFREQQEDKHNLGLGLIIANNLSLCLDGQLVVDSKSEGIVKVQLRLPLYNNFN